MAEMVHTLAEAAEILRMPYRTLRDAVYAGRYPHRKISQRRRVMTDADIGAVLELIAEEPRPTANPSPTDYRQIKADIKRLLDS